jgi:hypothetical protein
MCLAAAALEAAGAEEIGKLFNTPEERARLDRLRRGEPAAAMSAEGAPARHKPAVTGYVQRSDGRNTVWIDGRPVVIASPGAGAVLDPRVVQPRPEPAEGAVRLERNGKEAR